MSQEKFATKGRTIRNPGRGGENSPKKFVQRKIPGKKFAQPLRERKKNRASKQQSANSLAKKLLQRLNA
jgi:hypothetical protein